jgi:RNA polymerase sigma factor (sigma-70 family)
VAIRPRGAIQRQLRTVFNLGAIGELTDGQLLERFAIQGGEAAELAFAALVERHGPMVIRVCRHALGNPNDADDAFQATFLILVKKARSLWVRDSLRPWLHRVAHRVATRARSSAVRMREHEQGAAAARPTLVCERGNWDELLSLLHDEIDRLPERYRVPVVLCDLQGLTHEKAARHLGWPVGTLKSRLGRARELLRGRLCRRGLGLPAGLIYCEKGLGGAFRAVEVVLPGALVESTVRAAVPIAAGKARTIGAISSRVAILIQEVQNTMVVTKLKLASTFLLFAAAGAAGVLAQQGYRSDASPAADQTQAHGPVASESRRAAEVDPVRAATPAYITQSRAMILTRLEEEVAEARARLDRTLRKFRSPDNPAVVRARETLEALVQRLDRIDRVLVDVVETYPTMVDFSGGPSDANPGSQQAVDPSQNDGGAAQRQILLQEVYRLQQQRHAPQDPPPQNLNNQGRRGDSPNDLRDQAPDPRVQQSDSRNNSRNQAPDPRSPQSDSKGKPRNHATNPQGQQDYSLDNSQKPGPKSQGQQGDSQNNPEKSGSKNQGQKGDSGSSEEARKRQPPKRQSQREPGQQVQDQD